MTALIKELRKRAEMHKAIADQTPIHRPQRIVKHRRAAEFCAGVADDVEKLIADEKAKLEPGKGGIK